MGEAEQRILQMLEDGLISADEAKQLLLALKPDEEAETTMSEAVPIAQTSAGESYPLSANFDRVRRFWLIPLFIATGALAVSGLGLFLMYQSARDVTGLGFLCMWSIFVLALAATILFLLTRRATWLYLRVEENEGVRFSLGLPLPLRFARWALRVARPFVPGEQSVHLETAASFLGAMKDNPQREPIIIDVDDEDGDKVQIYIG